jgi:hypothetical protein
MKKQDKNKIYIGIFIVFLMISSTLGLIYGSDTKESYNGYSFTLTDGGWVVFVNNQYWDFNYLPDELEFDSDIGILNDKVYVVIDSDSYFREISRKFALLGVLSERISLDEVDCSLLENTLIFNYGTEYDKIYKEDGCVYLEGYTTRLIDKLFYHVLGVDRSG